MSFVPDNIQKIDRDEYLKFIDVTPNSSTPTWKVIGIGIKEASVGFNPQTEIEQWIIEKNARTIHSGNQKQLPVTQSCYKYDSAYEFVKNGIDVLNYKSHILEVYPPTDTSGSLPAKMSDCLITVTSYSGSEIEYTVNFDRRPYNRNGNNYKLCPRVHTKCTIDN